MAIKAISLHGDPHWYALVSMMAIESEVDGSLESSNTILGILVLN